jgi:signal transduction histidine kinase
MARIVRIGAGLSKKALALVDNDPNGHAQWNTGRIQVPAVNPGNQLLVEWDEMFSIGPGTPDTVLYENLPPGFYRFNLNALTIMGQPTAAEYSMGIEVPLPFWKTPWFWTTGAILVVGLFWGSWRYRAVRHLRAENRRLEQQQILERERFRIARDIHDDLGARVTQISLASALAERNTTDAAAAEANFRNITQMAREMVASLYDTLWVVNPENDNLEAVGNYLCQMVNQLSSQAGLRCRLEVPSLPADVSISSHQRHNLNLAVKEAMHNTIKHAAASEVRMKMTLDKSELVVSLQDNGHGFDLKIGKDGNGLANLKHRLEDIGGSVEVRSGLGQGTTVLLRMPFQRTTNAPRTKTKNSHDKTSSHRRG